MFLSSYVQYTFKQPFSDKIQYQALDPKHFMNYKRDRRNMLEQAK